MAYFGLPDRVVSGPGSVDEQFLRRRNQAVGVDILIAHRIRD